MASITGSRATDTAGATSIARPVTILSDGNWWVPGRCLGHEHSFIHELAEFFKSPDDRSAEKRYPDCRHALATQYVRDAVRESARTRQWLEVRQA